MMETEKTSMSEPDKTRNHLHITEPSPWVRRFAPLVRLGGPVLDVASGGGRHGRLFLSRGHPVTMVDCFVDALAEHTGNPMAKVMKADLENHSPWPFEKNCFAAVVVVNYLYRPLMNDLLDTLQPEGVLIYETFAHGNESYSKPRNPDHLLKSGELLELVSGRLQVVAYEHGITEQGPLPGVVQRVCAINNLDLSDRNDGEPVPFTLFQAST